MYLQPSYISVVVPCLLVVTIVYFHLYQCDRKLYLGLWTAAWGLWLLAYIAVLMVEIRNVPQSCTGMLDVLFFLAGIVCLWGTFEFLEIVVPKWWRLGIIAVAALFGFDIYIYGFYQNLIPAFFFLGFSFIWTGISILRSKHSLGQGFLSLAFILWGIHQGQYPFLMGPWNHIVTSILGLTIMFGMLLAYFAKREELIKSYSFHDRLTGLYNRWYLEEELTRLDVKRNLPLSIIMVDLNDLKLINDTLGHKHGDMLLQNAAGILKECCRQEDIISRWGGDEFVILLPMTNAHVVAEVCQRIHLACREPLQVSLAMGYAIKHRDTQNVETILQKAEQYMYENKKLTSRGRYVNKLGDYLMDAEI